MLSTVDLLIKIAGFVKKKIMFALSKAADLKLLLQGGQMYWAFPFGKGSLISGKNTGGVYLQKVISEID
jgi:hypothetical protein